MSKGDEILQYAEFGALISAMLKNHEIPCWKCDETITSLDKVAACGPIPILNNAIALRCTGCTERPEEPEGEKAL